MDFWGHFLGSKPRLIFEYIQYMIFSYSGDTIESRSSVRFRAGPQALGLELLALGLELFTLDQLIF